MNDLPDVWQGEQDEAWRGFRHRLTEALGRLELSEVLRIEVLSTEEEREGCEPYVQFLGGAADGVLADAVSNNYLAPELALGAGQEALMEEIGWIAPFDNPDDPGPNFTTRATRDELDWLALMAVRALREVYDVLHPAFLVAPELEEEPEATGDDAKPHEIAWPTSFTDLVEQVDAALLPVLGGEIMKDDDGDIPIVAGDSMVFVQVVATEPAIDLFSIVVADVGDKIRALSEVNILNRDSGAWVHTLEDDRIMARLRLPAEPFVPDQLRGALATMLCTLDQSAADLVTRVGGRKFMAPPAVVPATLDVAWPRTAMKTVWNLEDDEPGSVTPQLAAQIFRMDQVALLGQIASQRRRGRQDLVTLLRAALRVVAAAEYDDERRSNA